MALDTFTPVIWSGKIMKNLDDVHVWKPLLSTEHTQTIKNVGDTVRINSIGRVTIASYTKDVSTLTPETLDGAAQTLVIDQANDFCFEIDIVDSTQNQIKLFNEYARAAAWGLADTADAAIATALGAGVMGVSAGNGNWLSAATVGTGSTDSDAYEVLVNLGVKLTEQNVPKDGRWAVIMPWFEGMLQKDPRFVSFGTPQNRKALANGVIGRAAGINISVSNNCPTSGTAIIAGYPGAAAYAEQLLKVVAFEPEGAFSNALKGLHVHGYKVLRPYALAKVIVTEG